MNLVLIGFMGVGKTSVGRLLASRLGRPFFDTDDLIEEAWSMSIREIFEKHGEGLFRKSERQIVARLSRLSQCVIATGGGAVLDPDNIARLREDGLLIHLSLPLDEIRERIGHERTRPLFQKANSRDAFEQFFQRREALYESCRDFRVDRKGMDVQKTVEEILKIASPPAR